MDHYSKKYVGRHGQIDLQLHSNDCLIKYLHLDSNDCLIKYLCLVETISAISKNFAHQTVV